MSRVEWVADVELDDAIVDVPLKLTRRNGRLSLVKAKLTSSVTLDTCNFSQMNLDGVEIKGRFEINSSRTPQCSAVHAKFLGGFIFEGNASIGDANFAESIFDAEANAICFQSGNAVQLTGTKASFAGAQFLKTAHVGMTFTTKEVDFQRAEFFADARFNGASFGHEGNDKGSAKFDGSIFHEDLSFAGAHVWHASTLRDIEVSGCLRLSQTTFHNPVTISWKNSVAAIDALNAVFDNADIFGSVTGNANWRGAAFRGPVRFAATFGGDAHFRNAAFNQAAFFDNVAFHGVADFSTEGEQTFGPISFQRATFLKDASFEHRKFKQETSFRDALFTCAPRFYYAELHPSVTFGDIAKFRDFSAAAIKRYQTLRHQCEELRSRHEEGLFQALEQRARRKSGELPKVDLFFSTLYDWFSVYGTSALRPLVWLFIVWLAWAAAFAGSCSAGRLTLSAPFDWSVIGAAALDSAKNVFVPFFQFRDTKGWAAAANLLESLAAVPFLAVFLLALRWRFRRG